MTASIPEPVRKKAGSRYVVHPYMGAYGVLDLSDDSMLRNWRGRGFRRIWRGTEEEAKHITDLLNLEFGANVSIVCRKGEPRENARYRAIARNGERKRKRREAATQANIAAFRKCDNCGVMAKETHQCQ